MSWRFGQAHETLILGKVDEIRRRQSTAPARPKALSGKASHHHEKARTLTDDDNFRIRAMRPGEIALAADWAAAEGWNPGDGDAARFATVDPRALDR